MEFTITSSGHVWRALKRAKLSLQRNIPTPTLGALNASFRKWGSVLLLCICATLARGDVRGLSPEKVSLSDPRVQPMIDAMGQVDRVSLGFTAVTAKDDIRLELDRPGGAYDAMLHVYGATSRTIGFRKAGVGYRWIFEQETHEGPGWWQTTEGTFRENILIQYQTEPVGGFPLNEIYIRYSGNDTNLVNRELTLAEVRPILAKWGTTPVEARPPDFVDNDFNPGLGIMALILIVVIVIAVVVGVIAAILISICLVVLLAAGTISTALIVGFLRRSVSAGCRTFFLLAGAILGAGSGVIAVCIVDALKKVRWASPLPWVVGVIAGLGLGVLCAWLFNLTWSYAAKRLGQSIARKRN